MKPAMLLLLNKVRQDRLGGEASPTFGKWGLATGSWGLSTGHGKIDDFIFSNISFVRLVVPGYQPVGEQPIPPNNV